MPSATAPPCAAIVAHPDAAAVAHGGRQHQPEPVHVGRQLDGGADDGAAWRVGPEVRVVMSDAGLMVMPVRKTRGCTLSLSR